MRTRRAADASSRGSTYGLDGVSLADSRPWRHQMSDTIYRQCTLCEAHCGIQVEVEGERVLRISGDPEDVLSRGYICPKAAALADIHSDPDRLRRPVKKVGGRFVEIGWGEALSLAAEGLRGVQERHGADSLATYLGNPG